MTEQAIYGFFFVCTPQDLIYLQQRSVLVLEGLENNDYRYKIEAATTHYCKLDCESYRGIR